ncbi:MAG: substrate-binding domain-containing protein [Chloroflexota bacterium]|nr:substrate-binding domain-containing protein [Chloroflexota bacterium]
MEPVQSRSMLMLVGCSLLALLSACGGAAPSPGNSNSARTKHDVVLATTTSTQDSGLLDVLVPRFEHETGYRLKPIAVGSGQALELGERGEADVLLVHSPSAEEEFMKTGAGVDRKLVMYNDFVLVGPPADPARIRGVQSASEALRKIARSGAPFYSRGDDSGTHKREQELWKAAGLTPRGDWYRETGSGMGQTLRIASEKAGYTLADRGTYLSLRSTLQLQVLVEGGAPLLNVYHVIAVNPRKFSTVNYEGARAFESFLLSASTQKVIGSFGRDKYGQSLFVPCAGNSCRLRTENG